MIYIYHTEANIELDLESGMKTITKEQAYDFLKEYGTPAHVIRHCEAVADVAVRVAERLNQRGFHLDVELIETSALLHDMARTEEDHQTVAANWLRERGYDDHADIIAVHMTYPSFNEADNVDETDLVCLGDRVCIEGEYKGIEQRFDYIVNKASRMAPDHIPFIESKRQIMRDFLADLEEVMGISLDELMQK